MIDLDKALMAAWFEGRFPTDPIENERVQAACLAMIQFHLDASWPELEELLDD